MCKLYTQKPCVKLNFYVLVLPHPFFVQLLSLKHANYNSLSYNLNTFKYFNFQHFNTEMTFNFLSYIFMIVMFYAFNSTWECPLTVNVCKYVHAISKEFFLFFFFFFFLIIFLVSFCVVCVLYFLNAIINYKCEKCSRSFAQHFLTKL